MVEEGEGLVEAAGEVGEGDYIDWTGWGGC